MSLQQPTFDRQDRVWFTQGFVIMANILAVILALIQLGILLAMFIAGGLMLGAGIDGGNAALGILGAVLFIGAIPFWLLIHPIAQLNPLVTYMALKHFEGTYEKRNSYVVQVSFHPRWQKGLQSVLDDADDIGVMTYQPDGIAFEGGALRFFIPYPAISRLESRFNVFPSLFLSGRRVHIYLGEGQGSGRLQVENRRSWLIVQQFIRNEQILRDIRARIPHIPYVGKLI